MKGGKSKCCEKTDNQIGSRLSMRKGGGFKSIGGGGLMRPKPPSRPACALNGFLEDFLPIFKKQFGEEDLHGRLFVQFLDVAEAKWKAMSDVEKAPYKEIAKKNWIAYMNKLEEYSQKMVIYDNQLRNIREEFNKEEEEDLRKHLGGLVIRQ